MPEIIQDRETGTVRCEHTKVAIIGAGPSRNQAPWDDDSWCFWMLNEIEQPRFDRHFELHPMDKQNDRELAWLATCPTPCYLLDLDPRVPMGVRYPLAAVLPEWTRGRRYRYFTCTFAYQIALALADGFQEIGLWGVDLDLGTMRERLVEKPCVEYWLGLAEGDGVRVTLPPGATLLRRDWLYGYDYDEELANIHAVCDDAALSISRDRWPKILQRLGRYYGGTMETEMARVAAQLGRIG